MVWMFWTWNMKQVGHFGAVLTVGVGLFAYNIARTLLRVPRWNVIATGVASALGWLSLAASAGLTIAIGKCTYEAASALADARRHYREASGATPAGPNIDDQKRIATPAYALQQGASFLVVGRPITQAPNPAQAAEVILAEMAEALPS